MAGSPQVSVNPRRAIGTAIATVKHEDFPVEHFVLLIAPTFGAFKPVIKTTCRHSQHFSQQFDRLRAALFFDKSVCHLLSLAKNMVAFFKMSRSASRLRRGRTALAPALPARVPFSSAGSPAALRSTQLCRSPEMPARPARLLVCATYKGCDPIRPAPSNLQHTRSRLLA